MSGERRVALVTGGAGAIGGAICAALRDDGHDVVAVDRRGGDVDCELADAGAVREAAARVLEAHGRCDVLVHAAAAFDRFALKDFDLDTHRRVQAVNVEAALILAHALAPGMAERGFGRIVLVVSDTVFAPPAPDLLPYVASKAALIGITRSLAHGLGPDGISVTAVAPGLTETAAAREAMPQAAFDAVRDRQALARTLQPHDVAATVAFLASDGAAALTGQTLVPDGGLTLR
jgi:NAD(P)-dependent dehydrogenase (short-subunit alcohol dehydrogenase family)